jgi:hypothetical protein
MKLRNCMDDPTAKMADRLRRHDAAATMIGAIRSLMASKAFSPIEIAVFAEDARKLALREPHA